jgi:cytochrome P450
MELESEEFIECPFPAYRRLRETEPVSYVPEHDLYIVTSYALASEVLRTPADFKQWTGDEMFEPGGGPPLGNPRYWSPEVAEIMKQGVRPVSTLVTANPPRHGTYRKVAMSAFSARRTAVALQERIQGFIDELIDAFPAGGPVDVIEGFAASLPPMVVADVLEVPRSDYRTFAKWADAALLVSNGKKVPPAEMLEHAHSIVDLQRYLVSLLDARRGEAGDDIVTYVANATVPNPEGDQRELTSEERVSILIHFLTGGTETTNALIGSMVMRILSDRALTEWVYEDPAAAASKVVEETLRCESPQQAMFRRTTRPLELGGVALAAGAKVLVSFSAANRDDSVFAGGDEFDPRRTDGGRHLAFGHGAHFCLGAPLARREAAMALVSLFGRVRGMRLSDRREPRHKGNPFGRGFAFLDVEYDEVLPAAAVVSRPKV